jgi:Carboxypeptidase regulatory-like domain
VIRAAILLIAFEAFAAEPPLRGRLCFGGDCRATEGNTITVSASEARRSFAWFASNGTEVVLGTIEPGQTSVQLRAKGSVEVPVTFAGSDPAEWPVPVTLAAVSSASAFDITIPAPVAAGLRRLRMPPGRYAIELSAPRHHPVTRRLVPQDGGGLGIIVFRRQSRISGRVREAGGPPIAGAEILLLPSGEAMAVTGADGAFAEHVADDWPRSVKVRAPGYGTRIVKLPAAETDTRLEDIELTRGGTVRAVLQGVEEATLTLQTQTREPVATASVRASEPHYFEDIEAGKYMLLAKGDGPLEKLGKEVVVETGETAEAIVEVDPATLEVTIRKGSEPVPTARLHAKHLATGWEDALVADERGIATTTLWQRGEFAMLIQPPGATVPFMRAASFTGSDTIRWTAELPRRKVAGEIVDERQRPVGGVVVTLQTEGDDGSGTQMRTQTDAAGRFELSFVEPGRQILRASTGDHLPEMRRFQLAEQAETHRERLVLRRAAHARVAVVDGRGVPIAGCAVVHSLQSQPLRTDDAGLVSIPLAAGETKVVYFLPRGGSFAAAAITPQKDTGAPAIRVAVPPPEVTLVVRTQTTAGDPVPNVGVALRFGGYSIPPGVMETMAFLHGLEISTGPKGIAVMRNLPAGLYELWPYFSYKEGLDIHHGLGPEAPVKLLARGGENVATLTFAREQ